MSARDELLGAVQSGMSNIDNWPDDVGYKLLGVNMSKPQNAVVDAILTAGYRKPRTITTAEELDALPDGSILIISTRVYRKERGALMDLGVGPLGYDEVLDEFGHLIVIHEPEARS